MDSVSKDSIIALLKGHDQKEVALVDDVKEYVPQGSWDDFTLEAGIVSVRDALSQLDDAIEETIHDMEAYEAIELYARQGRFLQDLASRYDGPILLDADNAVMEKCKPITYHELIERLQ